MCSRLSFAIAWVVIIALLPARPASGQTVDLDAYVLFGVSSADDHLYRYSFADSALQNVGAIHFADGATAADIEALAYVPRNLNLFGFWTDPTNGESRLVYINQTTAEATIVGESLGVGKVTGATTALLTLNAQGQLALGTDGDHDKGHGNDCDGVDEDNPGNSTGVSEQGMGHGAHSGCATVLGPTDVTPVADIWKTAVFAIQKVENEEDDPIDFNIDGGKVVPTEDYAAKVTILGAAITNGGQYHVPVTVKLRVGSTYLQPWGDPTKPVNATVNDSNNPRKFILPSTYAPGTAISVQATSWLKKKSSYNGSSNNHWETYLSVNSYYNSPQVLTLRNGSNVPNIQPFMNQTDISDFIRDYVDPVTHKVVLDENQAIYLFELGTTQLSSDAADFQDLVVLVTLGRTPADLADEDDDDVDAPPAARLVRVNTLTGAPETIMTLDRVYDGLAASPTSRFYATLGNQLYMLDPVDQSEKLMGTLVSADMKGLEYAGPTMLGFTIAADRLTPLDMYGQALDTAINLGVADLQSLVFMRKADEPVHLATAYD